MKKPKTQENNPKRQRRFAGVTGSAAVSKPYKMLEYMRENRRLRNWIREEGMRTNTCTYNILGEICEGCRCKRQPQQNDKLCHAADGDGGAQKGQSK